jgi:hypothetical protein
VIKKVIIGTVILYGFIGIMHPILWLFNRGPYERIVQVKKETDKPERLREFRKKLEESARRDLETYKWVDQRKDHAQIPIERAFDYYLRRPKP